jgi:hypothetical protein
LARYGPVVAIAGWIALWFRGEYRWIAFVVWGVGNGLATILGIVLALQQCPQCRRRGFTNLLGPIRCRHCGFAPGSKAAPSA